MKTTKLRNLICVFLIFSLLAAPLMAQQETRKKSTGPRRQLAAIVFAGLGGAVLGLSTLSFYGRPQDYLVNIAYGFAVGVIAGTAYVTFKTTTTREYYDDLGPPGPGGIPPGGAPPPGASLELKPEVIEEPSFLIAPAIYAGSNQQPTSYGAQLSLSF